MKLRKMLGSIEDENCKELMKCIETQNQHTLSKWALGYVKNQILPIWEKEQPNDTVVHQSILGIESYLRGEITLKEAKDVCRRLREMSKDIDLTPVSEAALRAIAVACAVIQTPTNALGFTFYAIAAQVYDEYGLSCEMSFYNEQASVYFKKILHSFKEIMIANEEHPVSINWNC